MVRDSFDRCGLEIEKIKHFQSGCVGVFFLIWQDRVRGDTIAMINLIFGSSIIDVLN